MSTVGLTGEKQNILLLDKIRQELSKFNRGFSELSIPTDINQLTDVDGLLSGGGDVITVVNTYNDLPVVSTVGGSFYWVSNSQGISWLPGSLGGTYYPKGIYYSNGVSWEYIETPYQATQDEVITGTNNDKFVTPLTLTGKLNIATFTVDLSSDLTVDFYAPYDLKINSVTNIVNAPTTTISVNSGSYTLGNLIDQGDMITVDVDVNGVINLNVVYE